MSLAGSRRYYKARAEGLGMYCLKRVEHALGCSRIPNESVAVAFSAQAVPVLLAELAADELTQGADELCETGQAWAYSLDITP